MKDLYLKRYAILILNGWTHTNLSMYDEEGVEGVEWEDESGEKNHCVVSSWDEYPEIPETVEEIADNLLKDK